ncbi:MAG: hypothetical protein AAGF56_11220 [Pseudomonadota bacterium]
MDFVIAFLIVFNVFLAASLFVARISEIDRRYAEAAKKRREQKAHFRRR